MMEINEFIEKIKEDIRQYLPEAIKDAVIIDDVEVVKMNDQRMHGLTFRMPGSDAVPTLYVNDMFENYKDGININDLISEMGSRYVEARYAPKPPEVDLSYDKVKDRMTVRLLEKKRNREFLRNIPHVSVGQGLALIADINMGEERGGDWRIAVNNNVLETLGIDKETLFADAVRTSAVVEPAVLIDMSDALFSSERKNLLERDEPLANEEVGGMYVLTNESGTLGAVALFYPDVKDKAAELLGGDYYILPSSTHEVILVPDAVGINPKELCDMVKQANKTVVEPKDILSDNVYHYSKNDRRLEKVATDRELGSMVAEGR